MERRIISEFTGLKPTTPDKCVTDRRNKYVVTYQDYHSGGDLNIKLSQVDDLVAKNWLIDKEDYEEGFKYFLAYTQEEALERGISEWEEITGNSRYDMACPCCGDNYGFWCEEVTFG